LFADRGVTVRFVRESSNSAVIKAVATHHVDVGVADSAWVLSLVGGNSLAVPAVRPVSGLKIIAGAASHANGTTGVVVSGSLGISGPAMVGDLDATTMAVDGVGSTDGVAAQGWFDEAGGQTGSLTALVSLPTYAMQSVVRANLVQAAVLDGSYLTAAKKAGLKSLADPITATLGANATTAVWITSTRYSKSHASALREVVAAVKASMRYANSNVSAARKMLHSTAASPRDASAGTEIPPYSVKVNVQSLSSLALLVSSYGLSDQPAYVPGLLWAGAPK
jgi:ABC-type nitrate/sulfonate/bicarbonate transport system substrate-binding protein